MLRPGVERKSHSGSLARSRAMASCPETAKIEPDSSSASLRSASRSQASSTSGSESRLAISRSSRCDRSTGANCRTSASRTSKFVLTLTSNAIDADISQFITASNSHRGTTSCAGYVLANVFRAKLLAAIRQAGLTLPKHTPDAWIVNCKHVGSRSTALVYLGRY